MTPVELKQRLVNEIKLRAYDDLYIDRGEEREILQLAVSAGLELDAAKTMLAEVCRGLDYVVESDVLAGMRDKVKSASARGKIDKDAYASLVVAAQSLTKSRKPEREVRKMVVGLLRENPQAQVKTGWFRNWYTAELEELGV
jgi:hypothetical protein